MVIIFFLTYPWAYRWFMRYFRTSLVAQMIKRLPTMQETWVRSLGWEDLLEKEMATHSSTLAWRIPWMEEPGGLKSMGSQRVGHDWATSISLSLLLHFRIFERLISNILVLLPGRSHGWRSLVGYSLWGCKESDTTERLPFPFPNTSNHMLLQFHVLVSIHPETWDHSSPLTPILDCS